MTSWQQYFSDPRINISSLLLMLKSPLHYRTNRETGEPPRDSDALRFGRVLHMAILEPEKFERLPVWRGGRRYGGAWTDFCTEHRIEDGRDYVTADELAKCLQMQFSVRSHPIAGPYLEREGEAERSVFWTHRTGAELKSRIDYLTATEILDVKTCMDATPDAFGRAAARYHYATQAAFYRDAVHAVTGTLLPFIWIAVEKDPPYAVAVYRARSEDLFSGRRVYEGLLEYLLRCGDTWPGIGDDMELELQLPPWAFDAAPIELLIDGEAISV